MIVTGFRWTVPALSAQEARHEAISGRYRGRSGERDRRPELLELVLSKEALETDLSRDGSRDEFRGKRPALFGPGAFGMPSTAGNAQAAISDAGRP
jgi:hypothetical protein